MTEYQHIELSRAVVDVGQHDFGFFDERDRHIGISYKIFEVSSQLIEEGTRGCTYWCLPFADTSFYMVRAHATRDSQTFGATQSPTFAVTIEEARSGLARRIDGARARYAKKYS